MKRKYIAAILTVFAMTSVCSTAFGAAEHYTTIANASLLKKYSNECLLFSVGYGMMTKNFEYNSLQ